MLFALSALAAAQPVLAVTNLTPGEVLRYPVALVEGLAAGKTVEIRLGKASETWPVEEGRFKALVQLRQGQNEVVVMNGKSRQRLPLVYRPMTSAHKVNVVYILASDGNTRYQTPLQNDPQDWEAKLDTAAKLMQTFTAESMHRAGFGRMTFNLDFDEKGKVRVKTLKLPESADSLQAKDGGKLWGEFYGVLDKAYPMAFHKNLVVMAFAKYNPETKQAQAHTALGGGGLGLFSNAAMWSWPSTLRDAHTAFTDATPVDTGKVLDDSAYRSVRWGLAATTIGAMLHEMGHTFGLPHTGDPTSIMTRGFDRFNQMFTLVEPPQARRQTPYVVKDDQIARWEPRSASQLAFSRWFQPDARSYSDEQPAVKVESGRLVVESKSGIGAVIFMPLHEDVQGDDAYKAFHFESLSSTKPKTRGYWLSELRSLNAGRVGFRVLACDIEGNTFEFRHPAK